MNAKQIPAAECDNVPESSWPLAVAPVLDKVEEELRAGRTKQALETLQRANMTSPWMANALGVCHLREGQTQAAVDTFRRLTVEGLNLRKDAPIVFKVNFATALLLSGNMAGCFSTLEEIRGVEHPAVERLRAALATWKQNLTLWERINWYMGSEPGRPVVIDPPGDLR
jgi:hypothetical protein